MFSKTFKWMRQNMKSVRIATVLSFVVLIVAFGVVQASGPMRPRVPMKPGGMGMWGHMRKVWYPMEPVPTIKIIAVVKDESVTFETTDFPEDEEFTVTMGEMYTRGINGIEVGTFNSGDGGTFQQTFKIPEELHGQYRISIRAQTDHTFPYYSYNWFYNNTAEVEATAVDSEDAAVEETADAETEESTDAETEESTDAETEESTDAETEETADAEAEETAEAGTGDAAAELSGQTWEWVAVDDPVQGTQEIDAPENYTIDFSPEGGVGVQADCNTGTGSYTADAENLTMSVPAVTLAMCQEGSFGDAYINYLHAASTYSIEDGVLTIYMAPDGGTLTFRAEAAGEVGTGGAEETEEAAEETEGEEATTEEAAEETEGEEATTEEAAEETEGEEATTEEAAEETEGEEATTEEAAEETEGEEATTEEAAEETEGEEATSEEATEGEEHAEGEGPGLVGGVWQWAEFNDTVEGPVTIDDPAKYTAEFLTDGTVNVQADCNSGRGGYTANGSTISVADLAMTRALCEEGSMSDDFVMYLQMAAIYFFDEGNLYMDLPADGGTMMFIPAEGEETSSFVRNTAMKVAAQDNGEVEDPVPSFEICTVVQNEAVVVVTADFPEDEVFDVTMGPVLVYKPMKPKYGPKPMPMPEHMPAYPPMVEPYPMGPSMDSMYMGPPKGGMAMGMGYGDMWGKPMPPKVYVPFYYEAGTLESQGGSFEAKFEIPSELAGYYRIQIMLRTDHQYPYYSYNWFYNNDAEVCNGDND